MQKRFLIIENGIRLLGFPLELTPTETRLLSAIAENERMSVDELALLLNEGVKRGNVAVHINAINRKAEAISHRKLVVFTKNAYEINKYM
ncbi:MAG: hypothetical protein E7642_04530 [Ruminococcaceae bacterium]|nr:hypothetical protein [Oscillospiraceae bacterium]